MPTRKQGEPICSGRLRAHGPAIESLEGRQLLAASTLAAIADAYVRSGAYSTQNFGAATSVQVKKGSGDFARDTYLQFDISKVSSVTSAKLRLFGHASAAGSVGVGAYAVSSSGWAESTITYANKPAAGSSLAGATMNSLTDGWVEWDVTAQVKSEKSAGHSTISLALRGTTDSSPWAQFSSNNAGANGPQLVIGGSDPAPALPFGAPSPVTRVVTGAHSIWLSWPAVTGAFWYRINRRTGGGAWTTVADVNSTTYSDINLVEQTLYDYQVFAAGPVGLSAGSTVVSATTAKFKLQNNLFANNPDMSSAGIPKVVSVPPIGYLNGAPDTATARYWARYAAGIKMNANRQPVYDSKHHLMIVRQPQNLVIDQEAGIPLNTAQGRNDMMKVIAAVHDEWTKYSEHPEFKKLRVGIFGDLPTSPPQDLNAPGAIDSWHAQNDARAALASAVDFIVPVLYTDTTDQSSFGAKMSLLIREARRYNKPVIAYIWPEYFEQLQSVPRHETIPGEQWQAILDEVRNEADGAVLWGGVHHYNANLPWAKITLNYLNNPVQAAPPAPTGFNVDPVGLHLTWQGVAPTSRVRIERSVDGGAHWVPIGETDPGAASFDDPNFVALSGGFTPSYRIQAYNAFASSAYVTSAPVAASRDALAVNHAFWAEAKHPGAAAAGTVVTNLWPLRWVEFQNMAFRQNVDHITAHFTSTNATMEIWLDCTVNSNGTLSGGAKVGSMTARRASADSILALFDQSAPVNIPAGGNHNVFVVTANNGVNDQIWLDWVQFGSAGDAPAPPRHLSAASQGSSRVMLNWFDASDDETGFRVERSSDLGNTWVTLADAPANNPPNPSAGNSLVTYVDYGAAGNTLYTYRVSALHFGAVARNPITDVAYGNAVHTAAVKFSADSFDRSVGLQEQRAGELFQTEIGLATHQNESPVKGTWVKYSGVDFGGGSSFITLDLSPLNFLKSSQTITFYIDRKDSDHKIGSFTPNWSGDPTKYEEQTLSVNNTFGVHDLYLQFDDPNGKASIKTLRIDHANPVPIITSSTAGTTNVKLNWSDSSGEVTGYIVQWRKVITKSNPVASDFIGWSSISVSASTHSYDVQNLSSKRQYEFRVIAKTASGNRPSAPEKHTTH